VVERRTRSTKEYSALNLIVVFFIYLFLFLPAIVT
ncbi:MAG: hypothetical protein ACI8RD_008407, partial [Bacillariaceae sp.]